MPASFRTNLLCVALAVVCLGCFGEKKESSAPVAKPRPSLPENPTWPPTVEPRTNFFSLFSDSLKDEGAFPAEFTCKGADTSPSLYWKGPRDGTATFVVVLRDPDAAAGSWNGNWIHWVLFNIPAEVLRLEPGVASAKALENGAQHGLNDWSQLGYRGPCPPEGQRHQYLFEVHALDTRLALPSGSTYEKVHTAMQGHVLDTAALRCSFEQ